MTARAVNKRQFEERDRSANVPGKILAAVALFGVAILLLYICFASPQAGTSMGEIKNILCALGGDMAFVLPLILLWIGVLCIGASGWYFIDRARQEQSGVTPGYLGEYAGKCRTRSYDDRNGVKKYVTEVWAENIEFLSSPRGTQDSQQQGAQAAQTADNTQPPF